MITSKFQVQLTLIFLIGSIALSTAQTVTNGSFTNATGNSVTPAGWTNVRGNNPGSGVGSPPTVDVLNMGFSSYSGASTVASSPSPNGGTWVGISSINAMENEAIEQNVPGFIIGTTYQVQLWVANFGGDPFNDPGTITIYANNVAVVTSPVLNMIPNAWIQITGTFVATATNMTMQIDAFHSTGVNGSGYYVVDGLTIVPLCNAGGLPVLNLTQACLSQSTFDLSTITASNTPVGNLLTWHSSLPVSNATQLASITNVPLGNYYAAFFQAAGNCYGPPQLVELKANPTASFSVPAVCSSLNSAFTDLSTAAAPAIINNWEWSFSDGTTSALQNPTHAFSTEGIYSTKLVVTTTEGCKDSITINNTVWPLPIASFSTVNNCLDVVTNFTNTSSISSINTPNTIATNAWTFGDASNSALVSPTHLYATTGTYNVTLTTTSSNGCVNSITNPITIHPKITPAFTVPNVCANTNSVFTDQSIIASGTIIGWNWDFGGGNTSAVQNPSYNFVTAGTFPVTLTTTSDVGCVQTLTQNATTYALPIPNFSAASVCAGINSTFTDLSTVAGPDVINTWAWTFSDGSISALQNPSHSFPTEGIYANNLVVTTANACTASVTLNNTVWPLPAPSFTAVNNCFEKGSNFLNTSVISSVNTPNTISNYTWDFGDGTSSTLASPTHLYGSAGTFTVQLNATSSNGCVNSTTNNITIYSLPLADFSVNPECLGKGSNFVDFSSSTGPDFITSWDWTFGDNSTSNLQNPTHAFALENTYSNRLIVTSNQGCKDTIVKNNTIWPLPNVDFTVTDVCKDFANGFVDNSTISNQHTTNSNAEWLWTMGDGSFMTTQNGTHVYVADGIYNVKLRVTSNNGCRDSLTKNATVYPKPNALMVGVDLTGCSPICPSINSISTVSAPSVITNLKWEYSDGAIANGTNSIRCFENSSDETKFYDVTLFAETDKGCRDTSKNMNYIQVYHLPVAAFSYLPTDPDIHRSQVEFTNESLNASSYNWVFSNGMTSSNNNPEVDFDNGPGFYIAKLTAITINGCTDTTSKIIHVKDVVTYWVPNIFTPDGNEYNNTWKPIISSGIDEFSTHVTVFNRWGEMIWESQNSTIGWDGTYGGKPVQDGSYTWKFEYKVKGVDDPKVDVGHVIVNR